MFLVKKQTSDFCGAVDAEEATYQVVRFCNEGCTRFKNIWSASSFGHEWERQDVAFGAAFV